MDNFLGEIDELKCAVDQCGIKGVWTESSGSAQSFSFRGRTGEILNWWPKKGTLQFQGKKQDNFRSQLATVLQSEAPAPAVKNDPPKRIFIVHGHDRDARDQLELILMRLGLQPFILQNSDSGGKTIIESLEHNIYQETAFGIVLLTPDDYGYTKDSTDADRQPRARQNVILEMGMVMASLGRDKMAILKKGALEIPSDTDGILRIEFNEHVREIVPKLAQRLQAAGFDIDSQKIAAAAA